MTSRLKRSELVPTAAVVFAIALMSVASFAQSPATISKTVSEVNGSVKGNVYENTVLGLRIHFPKSMEIDSKEQAEEDLKEAMEFLKKDRKGADQRAIEQLLARERIVFSISTPEGEDPVGAALNLTIKKVSIDQDLRLMTEKAVDFFSKSTNFKLEKAIAPDSLGGLQVFSFTLSMDVDGNRIYSRNYAAKRNGYAMTFSIAYIDEKQLMKMEAVIRGLETF